MQRLECGQLFDGCPGVVEAETNDQVLAMAAAHAKETHGLDTLDDQTVEAVKAAIVSV